MKIVTGERSLAIRVLLITISAGALLVAVHLYLQYLNLEVFAEKNGLVFELSNRFDLDDESSVPTWFSQFLMLLISASAGLAAFFERSNSLRRVWLVVALLTLVFSIDEVAGTHEFSLQIVHNYAFKNEGSTLVKNAWLIAGPAVILLAVLLAVWVWRTMARKTFRLLVGGGLLFLIGSIAIDWFISGVDVDSFLSQGVLVAVEEGMELVGLAVILYAVMDYLAEHHEAKLKRVVEKLR